MFSRMARPKKKTSKVMSPDALIGVTNERRRWALYHARFVAYSLLAGNYERAISAVETAKRADPQLGVDSRDLSVQQRYDLPLPDLLDVRTSNALEEHGIFTVHQLAAIPESEIRQIPNVGTKVIESLDAMFKQLGVRWLKRDAEA